MKKNSKTIYDRSALARTAGRGRAPRGLAFSGNEPKLTIRVMGRCNFRCPLCSTFSSPERPGRLKVRDFKRAIDILKSKRFQGILNISGGEPLLHPDLVKMLSYAVKNLRDAKFVLFTNGFWVGQPHWKARLKRIMSMSGVLLRFSIDRQHVDGAVMARGKLTSKAIVGTKAIYIQKALALKAESERLKAKPGKNFDFAYKGTPGEAREYLRELGNAPIYPILLQKNPRKRPREYGYMAIDIDESGRPLVYLTLGHLARGAPHGGLDCLGEAIEINRAVLRAKGRR
jgi:hypothetical protein